MKKILSLLMVMTMAFSILSPMNMMKAKAANRTAIVIIPGMLGSTLETDKGKEVWLSFINYSKMELSESGSSVYNVHSANYDNYGASDTYKTLYKTLKSAYGDSMDIIFYDYDFRMDNTTAAANLATEVKNYDSVILVAHSMGGLVASRFLANSAANRSKTKALITIGTPYVGSAKCINVMETGEMITVTPFNITLFGNTMKKLGKNSVGAYELIPTNKYYSYTGSAPLKVGTTTYLSGHTSALKKTAWGVTSSGSVKTQFGTADAFHSSLFNSSGKHVTDWSGVPVYRLVGTKVDTIATVNMNTSYKITSLTTSNNGDGTVLYGSAGLGAASYSYTNVSHTDLVKETLVLNRIKTIITSKTGIQAKEVVDENTYASAASLNSKVVEYAGNNIKVNKRGWIVGSDDERINIYANKDAVLTSDGKKLKEDNNIVYDMNGNQLGSVWLLGDTGKKMYCLYDGQYKIKNTKSARIEYMDGGYFASVVKYSNLSKKSNSIAIGDFSKKTTKALVNKNADQKKLKTISKHVFTDKELQKMNMD